MKVTRMFVRRRQIGMTQDALARAIGVTQPRISAWERGRTEVPVRRRDEIARVLGIDADTLTDEA